MFAASTNHHLPRFFSWVFDPKAEAIDAFKQRWDFNGYANPPFNVIGQVLQKVAQEKPL
jgi:hypothetical protein